MLRIIELDNQYQWDKLSRENRLIQANNVLAYLARNYEKVLYVHPDGDQTQEGITDAEDSLNSELQDPRILDPKYLNAGDSITLKLETDYSGFINYQGKRVKWQEIQSKLAGNEFLDYVPISVRKNNVITAYLHSPEWITAERVQGDVAEDKRQLTAIRERVLMSGNFPLKLVNA